MVAAPPYICGYIPLKAVALMTGVYDPLARGYFDLTTSDGLGIGDCAAYRQDGDRQKVLQIDLMPRGYTEMVEENIRLGASPLPEIIPGAKGSYFKGADGKSNSASAVLVRGEATISIQLQIGASGRDNAADVAALMKLIAPKLITDASAPSGSPSPKMESPSPTKG
ncbi:hypothetical protein [Microtetraspora sp. NBRC 16547]|uniref:hypothetical protein n=1 Tax=Microtetraspora sp. NBRC 16547 TaxID=3030993 RepID=UPI0025570413|nr:hypothetical protein [Microtetraspora sp. NBRC 16547]